MTAGARIAVIAAASVLAGGAAATASAPPPVPRSASSEAEGVRATLSWSETAAARAFGDKGITLTIQRQGSSSTSPVTSSECSPCAVETPFHGSPVTVADLEATGSPVIVVTLTTGGAHCCSVVQFTALHEGTFVTHERNFGDPGVRVGPKLPDGRLQLISADDRFAYLYAPFAYSGLPLRVFELKEGVLVDVTRGLPAALARDAARQWRGFRETRRNGLGNGLIAAWAADEELLGHGRLVRATLAREARRGHLRSQGHYGPSGQKFVKALLRFLARHGYR
jgi:hypothetical protein